MYGKDDEKVFEIEIVLHRKYGGFSIDTEMALWLWEHRGWSIVKESKYDYHKKAEWPLNYLVESSFSDWYYHPRSESIEFRSQKDLIDCVRAVKAAHKDDKYPESYYGHIQGLAVVKVKVFASVEDYDDGHERVNVWTDSYRDEEED
jgi:hypothetical protein